MSIADVTLAVPTLNGGPKFAELIERLASVDPRPARTLVFDSESNDGSAQRATAAGCEVRVIRRASFDHGATRQAMAEAAATPFVAFLSQDALPDRDWLAPLLEALSDPKTAAATARILPREGASPLARRTALASPAACVRPQVFELAPNTRLDDLAPARRRELCRLDNVASLIRRDALVALPFPRTMMGEDAAFAARALDAGWRIRFAPGSVVRHSHEYGARGVFARYRDDARFVRAEYGIAVRPSLACALRGLLFEIREDWRSLRGERLTARLVEGLRSPWLRGFQVAGQWWGGSRGTRP